MKKATVLHVCRMESVGLIHGRDWGLCAFVHDEAQMAVRKENAEFAGKSFVQAIEEAGKYFNSRCPLTGEFRVGKNWHDTH